MPHVIVQRIQYGRSIDDEIVALLARKPGIAAVANAIRAELNAERQRIKAIAVESSRRSWARKREKRLAADDRVCLSCGSSMRGRRAHAVSCSARCRMRAHRSEGRPTPV